MYEDQYISDFNMEEGKRPEDGKGEGNGSNKNISMNFNAWNSKANAN